MTLLKLGVNAQERSALSYAWLHFPLLFALQGPSSFVSEKLEPFFPPFQWLPKAEVSPRSAQLLLSSSWLSVCMFLPMGK